MIFYYFRYNGIPLSLISLSLLLQGECHGDGVQVCGHNGETYPSKCVAWQHKTTVDYLGPCEAVGPISGERDTVQNKKGLFSSIYTKLTIYMSKYLLLHFWEPTNLTLLPK